MDLNLEIDKNISKKDYILEFEKQNYKNNNNLIDFLKLNNFDILKENLDNYKEISLCTEINFNSLKNKNNINNIIENKSISLNDKNVLYILDNEYIYIHPLFLKFMKKNKNLLKVNFLENLYENNYKNSIINFNKLLKKSNKNRLDKEFYFYLFPFIRKSNYFFIQTYFNVIKKKKVNEELYKVGYFFKSINERNNILNTKNEAFI